MSKQYTKLKRKWDDSWFKDKVLLVQAQASGKFYMRRLAFCMIHESRKVKPHKLSLLIMLLIKLMIWIHMTLIVMNLTLPKLLSWRIYLIMVRCSAEYVIESQQAAVQNSNSSTQQDALILYHERYKEQVKVLKEGQNVDLKSKDNILDSCAQRFRNIDREIALEKRIKQLDNIVFKRDQSAQTVHMLMKPQFFYDHTTKQALGFQNPFYLKKAQQLEPKLYVGDIIEKTNAIVIPDSEDTLMLAKESHLKMLLKQKDPIMLEKKVNTTPVDYVNSVNFAKPTLSSRPSNVEVPKELPKVSMVNTSLKKLKHHLASFDVVVKERTTPTAIIEVNLKSMEISDLNASLQEKVLAITALKDDLRKLKGKALVDNDVTLPILAHFRRKLPSGDLVEHIKSKYLLDQSLEYACRFAKLVQELLTLISKTCSSVNNTDGKIVVVTPKNKDKRVRFTEPVTSSGNTITKTTSTSNLVSNKPMLSSTGVKPSTSASGSQPLGNTKKDKTLQTPRNTQKNKVEAHLRKVKSSLKNKDCVIEPKGTNSFNFRNDHVEKILGYGDYQIRNITISRVYYVEGLGHNLFSVGQFCDSNLEVAFCQHTCFIRNLEGVDLLTRSRGKKSIYSVSWRYDGVLSYMSLVKGLKD
ncbi:hypothetical protein Tco_0699545 [Tanacetum coccineum]